MQENNNKALKRVVLLVVIVLPSVFYLLMTMGKHNFIYLPNVVFTQGQFNVDRNGKEFEENLNYKISFSNELVKDLKTNNSFRLGELDNKVYAIQFFEKDSVGILDASLFFKGQTQLAEKLRGYDMEIITFYKSKNASSIFNNIESKIDKTFHNWRHISMSESGFEALKSQFFIEPIQKENIEDSRKFMIIDKERQLRTGFDKQQEDKYIFAYDVGREYSIKLLVEDLKLLLAEYHRELKSKKKNEE